MRFNVLEIFGRRCIVQTCLTIIAVIVIIQLKWILRLCGKPINQRKMGCHNLVLVSDSSSIDIMNNHGIVPIRNVEENAVKILMPPASLLPFPTDDYNRPFIDKANKFLFCYVPKNSCTQMKAAFCRKFGGINAYIEGNHHDYIHEVCARTIVPRMKNITALKELYRDPSWMKLAIIRDPIERFVSAFVDKCQRPTRTATGGSSKCFNSGTNFTQFVDRFRQATESYSVRNKKAHMHLFDHFMPQFWLCGFNEFFEKYKIIKMGKDNPEFPVKIRNELYKFEDWVPIIKDGWGPSGSMSFMESKEHESPNKVERENILRLLQDDISLADIIYQIFYVDYLRFRLTIPKWISKNCQRSESMELAICQDINHID